MYLVLRDQSQ